MDSAALENLLRRQPRLWRGRRAEQTTGPVITTGFPDLDAALPGGGWPLGALLEIRIPCLGVGELRLLLPALGALSRGGRHLAWVAPPHRPYAPALLQAGVDLAQVLVVESCGEADIPWTLEKLLRSGACGAVLAWPRSLADHQARRLQLAAEENQALAVLFLLADGGSPHAALRLKLQPLPEGLGVELLKARGSLQRGSLVLVV